jgi:sugar phosphate isomerase/epimerase
MRGNCSPIWVGITRLAPIAVLGPRIVQDHAHDNHGIKDEHLFPGDGTIDWSATTAVLNALPAPPAIVQELSSKLSGEPSCCSSASGRPSSCWTERA